MGTSEKCVHHRVPFPQPLCTDWRNVPLAGFDGVQMLVDRMLPCRLVLCCCAMVLLLTFLFLQHPQSQCGRKDMFDIP